MRKRYFFLDIDQTLGLGITQEVPESAQYCLDALQKQGHFVAIATGRLQCDGARFAEKHGITSLVADGGNSLTVGGKILEMEGLPLPKARALLEEAETLHRPWSVVLDNTMNRYTPYEDYPRSDPRNYMQTIVKPLNINTLDPIYKIMYATGAPGEQEVDSQGLIQLPYIDGTILVEPADKGLGIEKMMALLQADPADAVVFGDGYNDITMFRKPFFAIAMGNARQVIKDHADYITTNVDENGILHACQHFGWVK